MILPTTKDERIIAAMRKVLEEHGVFLVREPSYDHRQGYLFPAILRGNSEAIVLADILRAGLQYYEATKII